MERKPTKEGRESESRERREGGREDSSSSSRPISVIEAIHEITKHNARAPLNTDKQLSLYLRSWWSKTYNRPLKDPLLQTYSVEELLYEFYDRVERNKAEEEQSGEVTDKMEEARFQDNLDWAEEEEQRELEEIKKQETEQEKAQKIAEESGMGSIEDVHGEWMEEQVQKELDQGKQLFGDDYGEDIEEEF